MGRISEFSVGIFIIMRKYPIGAFKHCNNSFKFDNWLQQEIRSNFMNLDGSYVCHCQCTARCEPAVCRRWTVGRKEGRREGGGMIERPSVLPSDTADVARAAASDDAVISAGKVKGRQWRPIWYNLNGILLLNHCFSSISGLCYITR